MPLLVFLAGIWATFESRRNSNELSSADFALRSAIADLASQNVEGLANDDWSVALVSSVDGLKPEEIFRTMVAEAIDIGGAQIDRMGAAEVVNFQGAEALRIEVRFSGPEYDVMQSFIALEAATPFLLLQEGSIRSDGASEPVLSAQLSLVGIVDTRGEK